MPEKAEAENMARVLNSALTGYFLVAYQVLFSRVDDLARLQNYLPAKLLRVYSRGKKVIFHFSGQQDFYLISSLGMTGRWMYRQLNSCRIALAFANQEGVIKPVFYDDERKFGKLELADTPQLYQQILSKVGHDWLHDNFPCEFFLSVLSKYGGWTIAKFLMDQSIFAGVGNYLKSEILYCAGVLPWRQISTLTQEEACAIYFCAKYVINEAVAAGGFTIERYLSPDETLGKYQARVYKKDFDHHGFRVHRAVLKGCGPDQTSYWVDEVQK